MNDFEVVFKENAIDSVIYFAALKAIGESVEKTLEYYTNNLVNTLILLNLMKKYSDIKRRLSDEHKKRYIFK